MIHTHGGSVLYVCTKFKMDRSFCSKVIWGPNISKLGHVTRATPI